VTDREPRRRSFVTHQVSSNADLYAEGTYVTGLTGKDIENLDAFEGPQYERRFVKTVVNGELKEAQTYIFVDGDECLEPEEWDYNNFRKNKMHAWAGTEFPTHEEFHDLSQTDVTFDEGPQRGEGVTSQSWAPAESVIEPKNNFAEGHAGEIDKLQDISKAKVEKALDAAV